MTIRSLQAFSIKLSARRPACRQFLLSLLVLLPVLFAFDNAIAHANPTASDDYGVTQSSAQVSIPVLDNDQGSGLNAASIEITSTAFYGSLEVDELTGEVVYSPDFEFEGEDSFEYRVTDDSGQVSNAAAVYISVGEGGTTGPTAAEDYASTSFGTKVAIPVLDNDQGSGLTIASIEIVSTAAHGNVDVDSESGGILYSPVLGYEGNDSFQYRVTDDQGQVSNTAIVNLVVSTNQPPQIVSLDSTYDSLAMEWTITGVVEDEVPWTIEVEFDGPTQATLSVDGEGNFSYVTPGEVDTAYHTLLKAVDGLGVQESQIYHYWLYTY